MAVLVGLDGRRLSRALPSRSTFGSPLTGPFPPLWSDGDTWDSHGDHGFSSRRLVSYENIYRSQTNVAACVNKLVRQIALVPIRVFKVSGPDNRTPVKDENNPLRRLLSNPAPRRGEFHLKQWLAMSALTHGNGLVAKFREAPDAAPSALLPVKWQYVSAYAEQGGPVEFWSTVQTGEERIFAVEESIHLAWEAPGGEIGTSPLEQLGTTVRLEDAAQRYATSSFNNGVRPSMLVALPPEASPDAATQIREQIQATHGGVDRSFLTLVVGGGATAQPLSHSAVEAELIEQRRLNFEEVCRVYDVAPQLLGDARNASYNTMTEVKKMLYQVTLLPWLDLIEATLQAQLIEGEEEFAGLDVDFELRDLLRGTPSEELAALVQAITNGVMAVNEARPILGLPKIPDPQFDMPMVPTNNLTPAAAVGDGRSVPNNPAGDRGGTPQAIESGPPTRPSGA
jgi:HK97 family phage portal protein